MPLGKNIQDYFVPVGVCVGMSVLCIALLYVVNTERTEPEKKLIKEECDICEELKILNERIDEEGIFRPSSPSRTRYP